MVNNVAVDDVRESFPNKLGYFPYGFKRGLLQSYYIAFLDVMTFNNTILQDRIYSIAFSIFKKGLVTEIFMMEKRHEGFTPEPYSPTIGRISEIQRERIIDNPFFQVLLDIAIIQDGIPFSWRLEVSGIVKH